MPGTQGLSACWLFSWEALKGPETQPRGFLQVDAFLTDLLQVGARVGYLMVALSTSGRGWGSGPGQQACQGESWAGRQGACQHETSQEDRWGGLRGWHGGSGGTLPCNPPSSLEQQTRAEGQTGGWSFPFPCSFFHQLSSGF